MKVLQLGKYYAPYRGGMETHLSGLCAELKNRVELEVLVSNTVPRTMREVVDGVRVTRCAELAKVASTSLNPTLSLELSWRRYELLHMHFPHPMAVMGYLGSLRPRRHGLVVTYHSDVVRQKRLLKFFAPFMHRVLSRADAILVGSPNYVETSEMLRPHRDRCHVVPFGIDASRFALTPEREAAAAAVKARYGGAPLLMGVGRLVYYKGFDHAIRALREVPEAHLLLVGEGPLRVQLESLARSCGVAERVHFLGRLGDEALVSLYYACDAFVLSSVTRAEAFALVQLEALACGLPVINTALDSGVPFVSRHEESGLTVPPGDEAALAAAIQRMLAHPEQRRAWGEAGRARVLSEFSQARMGERVLDVYRTVKEARRL
ncbi:glycosyltransferase [Archangium violaceum]|uniref:glycosyltransferase n=1 Tax=Archangium violaceum TaxID=83451 RepID=UPI00193B878A|nr:glycosyltransferase [Archangium violaceum]QRK12685.1 glycosyltransferase [Archangium violaceum]